MTKASRKAIDRVLAAFDAGACDVGLVARALTAEHRCARTEFDQREIENLLRDCGAWSLVTRLANGSLIATNA
jgi:hypothetical protein